MKNQVPPRADAKHWHYKQICPRLFRVRKTAHRRSEVWEHRFRQANTEFCSLMSGWFSSVMLQGDSTFILRIVIALVSPILFAIAIVYGVLALLCAFPMLTHRTVAILVDVHYVRFDPLEM